MAEIQALIFDMDGVIVDSNPVHREAWSRYNHSQGIETTEAMHQRMYGKRNDQIVRDFFGADLPGEEVAAHGAAKEALYREMIRPSLDKSLVPGIREFLTRHRNLKIGLATNAEPANACFILEETGLGHLFQAVANGHQVQRPKPDPEIYLLVARLLNVSAQACVVFEDSHSGIAAAKAAGMRVVGLRTTHPDLPGVDLAVSDFLDPAIESLLAS